MQIKAPAVPTNHRAQVLSALAALVVAGGAYGAISTAIDDSGSSQSSKPVVTNVAHGRILDGSPILRGTANRVDPSRVLDGSPLLRATSKPPTALQPPKGRPEGFRSK